MDAIDALEIHFGNPRTHQPLGLAHLAAAEQPLLVRFGSSRPSLLGCAASFLGSQRLVEVLGAPFEKPPYG
jgi:hypothetical protein